MGYLLLIVVIILALFVISPVVGFMFLLIVAIGVISTISTSQKQTEKAIDSIHSGSEKIWEELSNITFISNKRIVLSNEADILIDSQNKQIAICNYLKPELKVLPFSALLSCEIIENNTVVMKGGIGRAIVGGVIAGKTGAIVGAATRGSQSVTENLSIKIITSDVNESLIIIPLITQETKHDSDFYKKIWAVSQEVHSTLTSIIQTTNNTSEQEDTLSQIEKLAKLKEQGILTDEEFSKKKHELLDKV